VDQRADLFAFGCVLYSMVTGRQAFAGKNVHETLGHILSDEPAAISEAGPSLPADLQRIVTKCLAKVAARRYQHADDLVVDLRTLATEVATGVAAPSATDAASTPPVASAPRGSLMPWAAIVGSIALVLGAGAGWWLASSASDVGGPVRRFRVNLPEGTHLQGAIDRITTISPDGQTLVFAAGDATGWQLFRQQLNEFTPTPIPGTEGGIAPFFSPDGEWLAFESLTGIIKRMPLAGTEVSTVCNQCGFGSWTDDDEILFSDKNSLWLIPAVGGERKILVAPMPDLGIPGVNRGEMLPGGEAVLFEIRGEQGDFDGIGVLSLATDEFVKVTEVGTDPFYTSTGHIVFGREGRLFAVAFDVENFEVTSDPTPVVEDVRIENGGAIQANVSTDGLLVYAPAGGATGTQLVWVDRSEAEPPVIGGWRVFRHPEISPDGSQIAVIIDEQGRSDVHVIDIAGGTMQRLTDSGDVSAAVWMGEDRVAFDASSDGTFSIQSIAANGGGPTEILLTREVTVVPETWASSVGRLVFREGNEAGSPRLYELDAEGELIALSESNSNEHSAVVSHDGSLLAYVVQRADTRDVYVRPYPGPGAARQVSLNGGFAPRWSPDDTELFYVTTVDRGELVAASLQQEPSLVVGERTPIFPLNAYWHGTTGKQYAVHPDGRFLFLKMPGGENGLQQINVILNWFEELKQRVPTGR